MAKKCILFNLLLTTTLAAAPLVNSTGITAPGAQITFEELPIAPGTLITNQYAGLGATFGGANLYFQTLDTGGLPPNYLFNGASPIAPEPAAGSSVSYLIQFASSVTAASVQLLFYAPLVTDSTQLTMTALAGGLTQEFYSVNDPDLNNFSTNFYGFTGINFDAIQISLNYSGAPTIQPGLQLDNLAFNAAAGVPELGGPEWLPLLSAGLLLAISRRRV